MTDTTKPAPTIAVRFPDLPRRPAGFAPNPYLGPHWQDPEPDDTDVAAQPRQAAPAAEPDAIQLAAELGHSLQLSRAGALALTRLNLAIKCGDRHAAMAAMDRLHAVDAEMERMVDRLPAPPARDAQRAEWEAIARHLTDQKLSLAFEKLAMLSEVSGPDMVSAAPRPEITPPDFGPSRAHPEAAAEPHTGAAQPSPDEPPLAQWPPLPAVQASEWNAVPGWLIGLAVLLTLAAVAGAVVVMTGW